jgi:hypothetical protein
MSTPDAALHGFAYGEHLDDLTQRSLGYRLRAPTEPQPWAAEVEALARRLQSAPYPDPWPPADLFCSALLADGRRLVAAARYGLADHTPGHRRGGLELLGVVAAADLGVPAALAVYRWLLQRRAQTDDLRAFGGRFALPDALAAAAPPPAPDAVPVLPIRIWQEGVLLFAATAPSDPDHHLRLLEEGAGGSWQWLPLVGADFPLQTYAQRGPLVAWTPHLAGVALKLDRKPAEEPTPPRGRRLALAAGLALLLLTALTAANLAATLWVGRRAAPAPANPAPAEARPAARDPVPPAGEDARDQFARALYALLHPAGGQREWDRGQLLAQYERLAKADAGLRLHDANTEGKLAVGAVAVLNQRSARQVKELVRKALANKGYSPKLVDAACEDVYEQLIADVKEGR